MSATPEPVLDEVALTASVATRLASVHARVLAAGGDLDTLRLVAVTKGFGPAIADAACAAGLVDLGENYADELVAKAAALSSASDQVPDAVAPASRAPVWHFLGQIQRNKVARLASVVGWWQGLDRLEEGAAIARVAPGATVLVEVATTDDPARGGVRPDSVESLVESLVALGLDVRGLMAVAPEEPRAAAEAFATVRRLVDHLGLVEASMGMSDDFELAVAHGATMLRLGRALFGERLAHRI